MSRLLRAYLRALDKHPWKTQAVSTGVLMGAGDVLAQLAVERCPLHKYDPVRSSRYLILGTLGLGPVLRSWYLVLERIWGPSTNVKRLIGKVAMDQLLFAPAIIPAIVGTLTYWECKSMQITKDKIEKDYCRRMLPSLVIGVGTIVYDMLTFSPFWLVSFIGSMTFLQHKSVEATKLKFKQDYWSILFTNWKLWPAAQLINFYYIPFQHRILYVQVVALFWNTYLAWKISFPPKSEDNTEVES